MNCGKPTARERHGNPQPSPRARLGKVQRLSARHLRTANGHGDEIVHVRGKSRGTGNRWVGGSSPPRGARIGTQSRADLRFVKRCAACGAAIPGRIVIDGKIRVLSSRSFCTACSPFGGHNSSRRPLVTPRARRLESWAGYSRRRRVEIKERLVAERGGRCEDCGYAQSIRALEFHHRDPRDKQFSLGGFLGNIDRARGEADKCVLVCANCHRARHTLKTTDRGHPVVQFRQRAKQRAVAAMGGACRSCGRSEPVAALEFHHLEPGRKEFAISTEGTPRSWPRIEAELAKCVLLCANCHREVHAGARILAEDEGPYRACAVAADPLHKRSA